MFRLPEHLEVDPTTDATPIGPTHPGMFRKLLHGSGTLGMRILRYLLAALWSWLCRKGKRIKYNYKVYMAVEPLLEKLFFQAIAGACALCITIAAIYGAIKHSSTPSITALVLYALGIVMGTCTISAIGTYTMTRIEYHKTLAEAQARYAYITA
jgi:hypothetical protein